MNIDAIEQKIISCLEGELSSSDKNDLMSIIEGNEELELLWKSYERMYHLIDEVPVDVPSDNLQFRFNEFIENQQKDSSQKTISIFPWKKVISVAAALVGLVFIWNISSQNKKMGDSLANVNNQLHEMMQDQSATERIKTIRVNYAGVNKNSEENTIKLLIQILSDDESSNVRLAAVETLEGYAHHDEVRSAMIRLLGVESDGAVKHAIINVLGQRIDQKTKTTLENIVNDDSQEKFVKDEAHMRLIRYNTIKS